MKNFLSMFLLNIYRFIEQKVQSVFESDIFVSLFSGMIQPILQTYHITTFTPHSNNHKCLYYQEQPLKLISIILFTILSELFKQC